MSILVKSEEIIVDTTDYNSDEAEENIQLALEDSGGETYHQQSYHVSSPPRQRNNNVMTVTHMNMATPNSKNSSSAPKNMMENEKRIRREIANSNERRRMQSINAGFQSLRSLLPQHEGEKLSKAAILQQTAQYIVELERSKTHLLSQNSQLKRLLGQHEVGSGGGGGGGGTDPNGGTSNAAIKKRKLTDNIMTITTISDSSDEGLGSMSPEPVTLLNNNAVAGTTTISTSGLTKVTGTSYVSTSNKEISELKTRLETERKRRQLLEDRLRQLERQIYPSNQFIQREVIEHTDNIREETIPVSIVEIGSLPEVGRTQVVLCSAVEEMQDDEAEVLSDMNIHEEVILSEEPETEFVEVPSRLQPILEAAIKAEPKVEVERINESLTKIKTEPKDGSKQSNGRMYLTSTSRQNLETIVEAIRHLEGDDLFGDVAEKQKKAQEAPLALTTKQQQIQSQQQQQQQQQHQRKLPAELSPFLQLKKPTVTIVGTPAVAAITTVNTSSSSSINSSNNSSNNSIKNTSSNNSNNSLNNVAVKIQPVTSAQQVTIAASSLKQCRPGVIVAKQIS